MKLSDIRSGSVNAEEWEGYQLPKFDLEAVRQKTHDQPTWIHFGAGNIFRAFPAAVLRRVLDSGKYDRGVIAAEGFDFEIIDKAYRPYDNLSLLVLLKSDGSIEKRVVASITESLKADPQFGGDWSATPVTSRVLTTRASPLISPPTPCWRSSRPSWPRWRSRRGLRI